MRGHIEKLTDKQRDLAARHHRLCWHFAKKCLRSYRPLPFDDIVSSAQLGLMRAASLWDKLHDDPTFVRFAWYWMQTYAKNERRAARRDVCRWKQLSGDTNVACPEKGDAPVDWQPLADKLRNAIDDMTPKQREILTLRLSGVGGSEIARRLDCSKQNVSRVLRTHFARVSGTLGMRLPTIVHRPKKEFTWTHSQTSRHSADT